MTNRRHCASCGRNLTRPSYSRNQWSKNVGVSRCHLCVENGGSSNGATSANTNTNRASQTARNNNASSASFPNYNLENPFAEGGFRWVAKGTYTSGEREGEPCVCKWFKTGHVWEASFFSLDIKTTEKALELVKEFNSRQFVNKIVMVNIPQVWTFIGGSGSWANKKVLQEPFIEKYVKFNSNSGWADGSTPWPRVMQALSHFSYHVTGGQFLLCDLQGGVYSNAVALTDPVILSRTKSFGVTDLGPRGISSFFSNHRCNEFCKMSWTKPADTKQYFRPQEGTSMMETGANRHVPTQRSRNVMPVIFD